MNYIKFKRAFFEYKDILMAEYGLEVGMIFMSYPWYNQVMTSDEIRAMPPAHFQQAAGDGGFTRSFFNVPLILVLDDGILSFTPAMPRVTERINRRKYYDNRHG